jgi:hypothetical protein
VTLGLHSWPTPLQAFALVASPRLGLRQVVYIGLNFGAINEEFLHHLLGFLTYPLGDMVKMEYQVQGRFIYIIIYVSDCVRNTIINTKWGLLAKNKFTIVSGKMFLGLNIFLLFRSKKFHSNYQNCHIEDSHNINALGKLFHTSKFKREAQDIVPISLGPTMTISCVFHSFQISQSSFNCFVFMGKM